MQSVRLRRGKADYVTRVLEDGGHEKVCLCIFNADFSVQGCIAQVPGGYLEDVMENKGVYSKEANKKLRDRLEGKLPALQCAYCYARRHNHGKVTPLGVTRVQEKDKKKLEKGESFSTEGDFILNKPSVVRIGKNVECGHPFYRPVLIDFLEMCKEFGTRVIFPTKTLELDKKVVQLIKDTNSFLSYSIGWDCLEPGVCSQGYTNKWRIAEAEKYASAGINTAVTIVCDVTSSIEDNASRGNAIKSALASSSKVKKRILPMRPNKREIAKTITGKEWDELVYYPPEKRNGHLLLPGLESALKEQRTLMEQKPYLFKSGDLIPRFYHPDYQPFVNEVSVCGRIGDNEHCDKCHLLSERIIFPVSELAKVEYGQEKKDNRRKYRNKKLLKDIPNLPFKV